MDYTGGAYDAQLSIYFFGDQTTPYESELTRLLHVKDCDVLLSFFAQTHHALRLEVSGLPQARQSLFPRFACINDLLARKSKNGSNPALELALLCLTELARFIKYHSDGSKSYPSAQDTAVLGLCTGSLAAAAVSASTNVFDLIPVAIETVLIAFRIGLRSIEVREDLEHGSRGTSPVWSFIVGMDEARASKELESFSASKGYSLSSRPYLSAVNPNSVTVSGPSKSLETLLQTTPFATSKVLGLPIYAPYHASHLYGASDVDTIIKASNRELLGSITSKLPVISCSSGKKISASKYEDLVRVVLTDILIKQLRWDNVLAQCDFATADVAQSVINPVLCGPNFAQSLASSLLKKAKVEAKVSDAFVDTTKREPDLAKPTGKATDSKIAIVGYSGRFPDADSTQKFWDLLHNGQDVHRPIPASRFDIDAHYDPTGKEKNKMRVRHGGFIPEPGLFDARFFNMSPREAADCDPAQRLAIVTAYEALEMAGFVPNRTPSSQRDRVGTFYGLTSDDWREVNNSQNIGTYMIPGGNRAFTPGRINFHFKFSGPSFAVDTACSSSFAAIHTACNSLWRGDCDTAVAGGTNILTNPDNFTGLDKGHFLSTTGNCKTFDDSADGYCRAEAVGTVILKRMEDALLDNDPIHGVILGAYTNHSAEADSITRPHSGAQSFIFDKMLRSANRTPLDVSYIEMHGTGTQTGDAVEMNSVLEVFAKKPRGPQNPLFLGSAKANIGHAEAASGVSSLIKVLMMMKHNEVTPNCGIKTQINRKFPTDLKARNVNIAREPTVWERPQHGKRTVFMNNFSAAGGNTAVLMEDAPVAIEKENFDIRSSYPIAISAKGLNSLQENIASLIKAIDETPDLSLPALSYTTTARRIQHNFRVMVTGSDLRSIQQSLKDKLPCTDIKPVPAKAPSVVFAFTGQGSTYSGMSRALYENISSFAKDIRRLDGIAQSQGFPTFLPMIDGSIDDAKDLSPVVTQVGTSCMQIALARLWASWGISPSAVVGHSLGEYAALHVSGVLSASDAIFLTGVRAQMFASKCTAGTHAMLAVKGSVTAIKPHLAGTSCEVACINGPNETVISGQVNETDVLAEILTKLGQRTVKLDVPFAFHSAQVQPILQEFENAAQGANFEKPAVPFISPLLQQVVREAGILNPSYLGNACRKTVDYLGAIESAKSSGLVTEKTIWIEIGPHPVCSGMVKSILGGQTTALPTLRKNQDTWQTLAESLASLYRAGADVSWNEYHRDFKSSHQVVHLPTYHWDNKTYWIQYGYNWCVTKGDTPTPVLSAAPKIEEPKFSTTAVQKIISEDIGKDKSSITIESDLNEPTLAKVVGGHRVNGAALMPSALDADIAMTLADYLAKASNQSNDDTVPAVNDVVVSMPIIYKGTGPQLFRATATADWNTRKVAVEIFPVTAGGKKISEHTKCTVEFGSKSVWLSEWKRNAYLIQSRIKSLESSVNDGDAHKIKSGMAYKLFGALVDYSKVYQGMQEVILDSAQLEGTARVKFQSTPADGNFYSSPYCNDNLGHLSGFIMNANDGVDSKSDIFINHGWDSMRLAEKISLDKEYRTYVRMQNISGTVFGGDVWMFDGDTIVGVYYGVKFQGVPRRAMDFLLPGGAAAAKQPAPKAKAGAVKPVVQTKTAPAIPQILEPTKPVSSGFGNSHKAFAIIAEEIGLAVSELAPNTDFADLGVDSLLTLTISSRLREELDMQVSPTLFIDYPTVKELSKFLGAGEQSSSPVSLPSPPTGVSSAVYTPMSISEVGTDDTDLSSVAPDDEIDTMAVIRCILAEEIGVSRDDLKNNTDFAELGLDSLMSLTVLARLREELTIDLPGSLFAENDNLAELEAALGLKKAAKPAPVPLVHSTISTKSTVIVQEKKPRVEDVLIHTSEKIELLKPVVPPTIKPAVPRCTSLLLQGNPRTAKKSLFLFPDGSGSATSYAPLTTVSPDVVVYGLNCPYMMRPQDMKCSIEDITPSYLAEIRRRQPKGPYYFGGWSAGGISAFDAAQTLQREGRDEVARLILIDSPHPIGLEKLPPRLYDFFTSVGLFGSADKQPPRWLIPHFLSFVDSLDRYRARAFAPGTGPKTHIIWAKDGVCKFPDSPRPEMRADDPREMKWLLNNRTDLSSNGWDKLVGGAECVIETLENANHFSLMQGERADGVSRFLERALL